jgi:DNA-binding response OmpR family regulator
MAAPSDPIGTADKPPRAPSPALTDRRILLVEDDDDTRDMLGLILTQAGYKVSPAADAEAALETLRQGGYHLLITDYDLPGKTGAQLLRQAGRERLLEDCPVLVVTAHPEPEGLGTAPVMHKPLEMEAFRRQVDVILQRSPAAAHSGEQGETVALVLYVDRDAPASQRAQRELRQIIDKMGRSDVRVEVRDVAEHSEEAELDRVVFVPTLVARCRPPVWILGDLRQSQVLLDVLGLCAVSASGGAP